MLSDYEAMGRLPRHIAKILSLCIVYCMDVRELMESAVCCIDDSAKLTLPVPDSRLPFSLNFWITPHILGLAASSPTTPAQSTNALSHTG